MNVIGHQRPAIAAGQGFRNDSVEARGKIFTICAVFKDRFTPYPADGDLMQGSGVNYGALRGMAVLSRSQNYCKYVNRTDPIFRFSS
jgi:hypothetical protein